MADLTPPYHNNGSSSTQPPVAVSPGTSQNHRDSAVAHPSDFFCFEVSPPSWFSQSQYYCAKGINNADASTVGSSSDLQTHTFKLSDPDDHLLARTLPGPTGASKQGSNASNPLALKSEVEVFNAARKALCEQMADAAWSHRKAMEPPCFMTVESSDGEQSLTLYLETMAEADFQRSATGSDSSKGAASGASSKAWCHITIAPPAI